MFERRAMLWPLPSPEMSKSSKEQCETKLCTWTSAMLVCLAIAALPLLRRKAGYVQAVRRLTSAISVVLMFGLWYPAQLLLHPRRMMYCVRVCSCLPRRQGATAVPDEDGMPRHGIFRHRHLAVKPLAISFCPFPVIYSDLFLCGQMRFCTQFWAASLLLFFWRGCPERRLQGAARLSNMALSNASHAMLQGDSMIDFRSDNSRILCKGPIWQDETPSPLARKEPWNRCATCLQPRKRPAARDGGERMVQDFRSPTHGPFAFRWKWHPKAWVSSTPAYRQCL
jgi:hypothetical protein